MFHFSNLGNLRSRRLMMNLFEETFLLKTASPAPVSKLFDLQTDIASLFIP